MDPHAVLGLAARRDAGRGRRDLPRAGQAVAPRPRRRPRGRAADGGDQRGLRPAARRRLDAAPRRPARALRRPARPRRLAARPRSAARSATSCSRALEPRENVWLVTPRRPGRARRRCSPRATAGCCGCSTMPSPAASTRCAFAAIEAAEHTPAAPAPPRGDAAGAGTQRPPPRFGELRPATAATLAAAHRARRDRRYRRGAPDQRHGATASSASPAIAHQPAS